MFTRMKKALFFSMAVAVVAFASCAKQESEILETPQGKTHVIHAVIDDQDPASKTAYTDAGVFSWVQNDAMKVVVYKADDTKIVDKYTYKAASSGVKVDFTPAGTPDYTAYPQSGFAVYPADIQTGGAKDAYVLALPAEYTVSGSDFSAVGVPLIGTAKTEDSYSFKTAVGVLKVTFSDVPSSARKVVLTSASDNLSGVCYLDATTAANGFRMAEDFVSSIGHSITVNFPAQASGSTINVYIPVPVGTISAGATLSVQMADGTPIKTTPATTQPITITRGHLTPISVPVTVANWESIGNGKFIDTYIWGKQGWADPVTVEIFKESTTGEYRMLNPYVIANGAALEGADEYFYFSIAGKNRVVWEWLNMGLTITEEGKTTNAVKCAMIDGESVAGYGNDFSHVVSFNADGSIAQLQLAPCYRTVDELRSGDPEDYDKEIGKDHSNGIIEIAFPGKDILMPLTIPSERIRVSANHATDGAGPAGLIDDNLATFWHTPWSTAYPSNPDAVYGQYVTVKLPKQLTSAAFNYCTRNTASQNGSPSTVVVGGTKDGASWTVLGTFDYAYLSDVTSSTWMGLPVIAGLDDYIALRFGVAVNKAGYDLRDITDPSTQWCNLGELKIYGVSTGVDLPYYPDLEPGQVWIQESMITAADVCTHDGDGVPALLDNDLSTYWHSNWYYAVTGNDSTYGIFFDIELNTPLQNFHFAYNVRESSAGAKPTAIVIGVSNDGITWTKLGDTYATDDMLNAAAGARVTLPSVNAGAAYKYLRFGITDSNNGDTGSLTGDLNWNGYKKCVNLAELLLFAD